MSKETPRSGVSKHRSSKQTFIVHFLWDRHCTTVDGAFHSGKQEEWTDHQLRSSPLVALTFPLLSLGEGTKAGGAEKEECIGKSLLASMNSVRVRANGYHYIQLLLARPVN